MRVAYGRPAMAESWARRILEAATICMALVICAVFLTERIRLLRSRVLAIRDLLFVSLFKLGGSRLKIVNSRITQSSLPCDEREDLSFARGQKVCEFRLELFDALNRDIVHIAVLNCPENCNLDFDCNGVVLRLLEYFDDAFAALELRL